MKKILLLIIIPLLLFNITGCKFNKEDVKLKDEKSIIKHARTNYGKATLINKENSQEKIIYTLKDNEHKFTYECSSYISNVCIDADCADIYYETTSCDFDENYQKYILDTLNLDNVYNKHLGHDYLFSLKYENEKQAKKELKNIAKKIKKIDKRKYFSNYNIKVYDNSGYIGIYDLKNNKYVNRYEEAIDQMTHNFAVEVNHNSGNFDGIKFLYYKRIQYKDVERLQLEWLYKKNMTNEDWTTAYYFDYYGKTYFMLDDKVFIPENVFGIYIADKNYTSYWFNN